MKYLTNSPRRSRFVALGMVTLVTVAAVAAMAQTPAFKPLTAKDKMAINGIGPVKIGMPLVKAIDATQVPWTVEASLDDGGCRYAKPTKPVASLAFMVVEGIVVRADVTARGIATLSGVQVGDTEAKVKSAYPGKITVEPHKYVETGHYLIYTPSDKKDAAYLVIFETDGKVVTSYRAGRIPEVTWIEGCL